MTRHAAETVEVVDPVCGMSVTPADAAGHLEYRGHTFYFCTESCLDR
jgi:Cu+-exporting ATPase